MSFIFYLMGKSATGKDTVYRELMSLLALKNVVMYTTRPMREGEKEGVQYYFKNEAEYNRLSEENKIIEVRGYNTTKGMWYYFTVDDGQINKEKNEAYLIIGTLESYEKMKAFYGADMIFPIYLEVDDKKRLERSILRESKQPEPDYEEVCRRFIADEKDFSDDKLKKAGIIRRFSNDDLSDCVNTISDFIIKESKMNLNNVLSVSLMH